VSNNVVRNNDVHDNARLGQRGDGIILSAGSGNVAYNNLVYRNNNGIVIWDSNNYVYNNTIVANGVGISVGGFGGSASSTTVRNNIVYNNSSDYQNNGTGTTADHNLIGVNPMFMNAAAADFRLQQGSPAIDGGVAVSGVTVDIRGLVRPQGATLDIGAYEFGSGAPAPAAPSNIRLLP
jgi:parallel beta-helix repeat protein